MLIDLPLVALASLRITYSPLWETVAALRVLAIGDAAPCEYQDWTAYALGLCGGDERFRRGLAWAKSWRRGPLPNVLPIPTPGRAVFETELHQLRHAVISAPGVANSRSTTAAVDMFCHTLTVLWTRAIAPGWSQMTSALEEDKLTRARALVTTGAGSLLSDLGPEFDWNAPHLHIASPANTNNRLHPIASTATLVPVLFCADMPFATAKDNSVAIAYQSRGRAALRAQCERWESAAISPAPLARLIGANKAEILFLLRVPHTTTALATALGLAPSTTSEHLGSLLDAELVHRYRRGRSVFYQLTAQGEAFVDVATQTTSS